MARIFDPCLAAGGALPPQIVCEAWLPPRGRATPVSGDDRDVVAPADRKQNPFDGLEILQHDPMLNHDVRFTYFVEVIPRLEIDRPGVDAGIRFEKRHPDAIEIAVDERPETAVGIAILRADARVQHERAGTRHLEDLRLQDHLAARDDEIRLDAHQKVAGLLAVRAGDDDLWNRVEVDGIPSSELADRARFPGGVTPGQTQTCVDSKRDDVEKAQEPDALQLPPRRAYESSASVTNDDETS